MSATQVDTFVSSLDSLDVPYECTTEAQFDEVLTAHLRGQAVGVDLEGLSVSLTETEVEIDPTPASLKGATTGVTQASFAIGEYGSVVVPSSSSGDELVSLFVDRHIAAVNEHDIVADMEAAFERFGDSFRERQQTGIISTGPSATADMGELVRGAHGPSEVRVIIVEDSDE